VQGGEEPGQGVDVERLICAKRFAVDEFEPELIFVLVKKPRQGDFLAAGVEGIHHRRGHRAVAKNDALVALTLDGDEIHPLGFAETAQEQGSEAVEEATPDRVRRPVAQTSDHGAGVNRATRFPDVAARILPRHRRNIVWSDLVMSSKPRVTVFIPAYNREGYICTAINSMLAQQYTDFEILVVDDGSTDRTAERVDAYGDPRVRLVRSEANLGIPASRNRGLELARGEYIALLDSDDYAYPNRLGTQVAFLDRHSDIVQVGSGCTLMNENGELLKRVRRHPLRPVDVDAHLLFHCSLINRTIMARTEPLRELGYDKDFPRCQDYDLHVRLAKRYRMANLPQLLVCGREHPGRITKNTRGLGQDRKMAIQAKVLDQLQIDYSDDDLLRHYLLSQKRDPAMGRGEDFLGWAEGWLRALGAANARLERFDGRAFRRVLAAMWAVACWHYAGGRGNSLPRRLLSSPLTRGLPGNFDPVTWARMLSQPRRRPALDERIPARLATP